MKESVVGVMGTPFYVLFFCARRAAPHERERERERESARLLVGRCTLPNEREREEAAGGLWRAGDCDLESRSDVASVVATDDVLRERGAGLEAERRVPPGDTDDAGPNTKTKPILPQRKM